MRFRALRHAESARHQKSGQQKHGSNADEAPFFADRRQHQVGIAGGDHFGIAPAGAGAPRSAGGERPECVRQLIAAVDLVVPWGEPHVDALHHGLGLAQTVADEHRCHHQHDAGDHQSRTPARRSEHREEHEERYQRGAHVFQYEEEHQSSGGRDADRDYVLHSRQSDALEEFREDTFFTQVAQALPIAREVAGQKEHHENLDELDGLERSEIDLGVVACRPFAECQEQAEESERQEERRIAPVGEAQIVERLERRQDQEKAAEKDAEGELVEFESVAQGVAQAEHEGESDAGEQVQGGQEGAIALEAR